MPISTKELTCDRVERPTAAGAVNPLEPRRDLFTALTR